MARNPKSLKNLKPFKKGKGKKRDPRINPNGAPKKIPMLKALMAELLGGRDGDDLTKTELAEIIKAAIKTSKNTKSSNQILAVKEILERTFGKVRTEDDGGMGQDLNITVNIKK